jgi:hypothetical protein
MNLKLSYHHKHAFGKTWSLAHLALSFRQLSLNFTAAYIELKAWMGES